MSDLRVAGDSELDEKSKRTGQISGMQGVRC